MGRWRNGSAPALQADGCGFKSRPLHQLLHQEEPSQDWKTMPKVMWSDPNTDREVETDSETLELAQADVFLAWLNQTPFGRTHG